MSFTHLHLHTEYSLLDGANRLRDLPRKIKELGMTSCAITDHGVMYGAVDFYTSMLEEGIKPIIGCEVYIAPEGRLSKERGQSFGHLILLAENNTGLQNLNRIVSTGFVDGYYYKPRVDYDVLKKHHNGIIALSSCLSGEVPRALLMGDKEKAKQKAELYRSIFGENNFFLEVQANGMPEQIRVNKELRKLSDELSIALVATNDCHYLNREDAESHEILLCMQTGKRMSDQDRMRMGSHTLYVKSEEEMRNDLPDFEDAIDETTKIAERCNVSFDFETIHLPKFEAGNGISSEEYLHQLSVEGLEERLKRPHREENELYYKRLNYELSVIKDMGFADYYLIVWDFIRYAREKSIMVGPGRGSGAGSLVAYALGITNIDPMEYNLLFERFLNVDRVSMPDFDIDFCYERRQEVIDYVNAKYGADRVCQVITFGTLAARACIRDVGRALDFPYSETDKLSKMIPTELGMTLERALEVNPELRQAYESDASIKRIYDTARKFEGMPRHASTHAAGVIISSLDVTDIAPLSRNDESIVVQYAKKNVERLGLLKFDFLGLRTLTVLRDSRDMIRDNHGVHIDFYSLDLTDENVYDMLSEGETAAVFQLESEGMTAFIKELKPESLEDIIAGVSLYRPGPMDQIPRYVEARHDPSKIRYHHPLLEPILDVTYGTVIYQEQVMQIVRDLGGFSLGQADLVRAAMSKKKAELMRSYEELFVHGGIDGNGREVEGAIKRGVDEPTARLIYKELNAFAGYAFNKSHAAAYALVAYFTAWLKFYYPVEFMAAMLNSYLGDLGQAANYVNVCKHMGIEILPPDVNYSFAKFCTEGKGIRFALGAIKNVSPQQINLLSEERSRNGKYEDFGDFLRRSFDMGLSKKVVESLIYASACDSFAIKRSQMLATIDSYYDMLSQSKRKNMEGQVSFFDIGAEDSMEIKQPSIPDIPEFSRQELLAKEKEMIGIYVTGHPLEDYQVALNSGKYITALELNPPAITDQDEENEMILDSKIDDYSDIEMAGMIVRRRNITTKKNELMSFLLLEDLTETFEAVVFPRTLSEFNGVIREGFVVTIQGKVSKKEDFPNSIIVNKIDILARDEDNKLSNEKNEDASDYTNTSNDLVSDTSDDCPSNPEENTIDYNNLKNDVLAHSSLVIQLDMESSDFVPKSLLAACKYWRGETDVYIHCSKDDKKVPLGAEYRIETSPLFLYELVERYGINNISLANIR